MSHGHDTHDDHGHASAPVAEWKPGPERVALLRKMHTLGLGLGLIFWPVAAIFFAFIADRIARGGDEFAEGIGSRGFALILLAGFLLGLAAHSANRAALAELDNPEESTH